MPLARDNEKVVIKKADFGSRNFPKADTQAKTGNARRPTPTKPSSNAGKLTAVRAASTKRQIDRLHSAEHSQSSLMTEGKGPAVSSVSLPEELWLIIFSYLDAGDLLTSSSVCRLWHMITSSNILWQTLHCRYVARTRLHHSVPIPDDPPLSFWKKACIKSCIVFRNQRATTSVKVADPFSGLPKETNSAIQQAGIQFTLVLVDGGGTSHSFAQRDVFYHSMSVTVRWYALDLLAVERIAKLRVYSSNPVVFNHRGCACSNSPCQDSLLDERDFTWGQARQSGPAVRPPEPDSSHGAINTYLLPRGLLVATWIDGGELAYVALNLPALNLIPRCLFGTSHQKYQGGRGAGAVGALSDAAESLGADGIQTSLRYPAYGESCSNMLTFHCALELRSYRTSFWKEQFLNIDCAVDASRIRGKTSEDTVMQVVVDSTEMAQRRHFVKDPLQLMWKTDLFKNITPDICILDWTLMDDRHKPIWCFSYAAKKRLVERKDVSFDYTGKEYALAWSDATGAVLMTLSEDTENSTAIVKRLDVVLKAAPLLHFLLTGRI